MGALKQQKEVLSALFYNDNDLLCRKKEKKKNNETQATSQMTSFTATLSIKPCENINQKLVVFRFWSHYFCKWES